MNQSSASEVDHFDRSMEAGGNSGHRLMKDRYVQEQIAKAQAEFAIKYDITEAQIIRDLIDIGEHAQLASYAFDVDRAAFVCEGRVTSDDNEGVKARQCGNDFLGHAVREIFLVGIAAHVLEWEHGDGGNSSHRLMKDRYVQEQIAKAQAEFAIKYDITEAQIIRDLIDIGEEARAAGNHAVALRAKELIGRHIGMWPTRPELPKRDERTPVTASPVILGIEEMTPQQRSLLKEIVLQAKAKERAVRQAAEEGDDE
jgi:hypothetical protein